MILISTESEKLPGDIWTDINIPYEHSSEPAVGKDIMWPRGAIYS